MLIFIVLCLIPYVAIAMAIGRVMGGGNDVLDGLQRDGTLPVQPEESFAEQAEAGWEASDDQDSPARGSTAWARTTGIPHKTGI